MVPLGGRPLLEYTVEWLAYCGIREMVINVHHQPQVIRQHFGDGARWGVRIRYSYEEVLLGTAGALKAVESFFDKTFLVWYGDNLCRLDVAGMAAFHQAKGGIATLALHPRTDATASGIVALDDDGRVLRFAEKPREDEVFSHLVNAGIYILEPDILGYIPADTTCDFGGDVFPALLEAGAEIYGYLLRAPLFWVDTVADYERTRKAFAEGRPGR